MKKNTTCFSYFNKEHKGDKGPKQRHHDCFWVILPLFYFLYLYGMLIISFDVWYSSLKGNLIKYKCVPREGRDSIFLLKQLLVSNNFYLKLHIRTMANAHVELPPGFDFETYIHGYDGNAYDVLVLLVLNSNNRLFSY
jgi:hypothetical protein